MNSRTDTLPTRIDKGGVKFQTIDWSELNVAHIRLPGGADAAPLLEGLPGNLCPCPHWGYVLRGAIHVRYADGRTETVNAGEVYYWPPGHTVSVDQDYESVEFSPANEMGAVLQHLSRKLGVTTPEEALP
jgi:hypothetical protein